MSVPAAVAATALAIAGSASAQETTPTPTPPAPTATTPVPTQTTPTPTPAPTQTTSATTPTTSDHGPVLPAVGSVSPLDLHVGDVMTLKGQNFVAGRWRNQVVFARRGIRPVFALAAIATTDEIRTRVPAKLLGFLIQRDGRALPTRFRVSVLSARLGPAFTQADQSPLISPPRADQAVPGGADCNGDGTVETPDPGVLGLAVVGLRLPGLPPPPDVAAPDTPDPPDVPDLPGLPGVPDVDVPSTGLPPASTPPAPGEPQPACPGG